MKKFRTIIFSLALSLIMSLGSHTMAAETPSADYILGAEDVVEVIVSNHDDLNRAATVRPDGRITLPRIGDLVASGKTARALAAQIQAKYSKSLNNAEVTVSVKEVRSRRARILGAVKNAGTFELKANWRLMDLVAVAGGLSTKPVRISGRVVRAGRIIPLDMPLAVARPDTDSNVALKPDDLVVLDEQDITRQVTVIGQVSKPGAYDLEEGLNPVSLIAQAGGPIQSAALSRSYVLRASQQLPLDLQSVLVDGQKDPRISNFVFVPGDALVIPENTDRYGVMGQVMKPGYYPLPERKGDATVLKALASAGGRSLDGDIRNATLTRVSGADTKVIPVNIEALLRGTQPDISISADDVIYVPQTNNLVNVLGKVNKPGAYTLNDNTSLASLLGEAGGSVESGSLTKAYVMRGESQLPVNLQPLVENGTPDPAVVGFKLQPGDVLVIPEIVSRYAVMGQVKLPGTFHFRENAPTTIIDALSSAGGQLADGNLKDAVIVRVANGVTNVVPVNVAQMMKKGGSAEALYIRPGDVLFVPQKKQSKLQPFLGPLAILASAL